MARTLYTNWNLPALMLEAVPDPASRIIQPGRWNTPISSAPLPVKPCRPPRPVSLASGGDIAEIFGDRDKDATLSSVITREKAPV